MRRDIVKLFIALVPVEIGFVVLYWLNLSPAHPSDTLQALFDLNGEANIPSWFSSVQLFAIGTTFFLTRCRIDKRDKGAGSFYLLLGLTFTWLSLDEAAIIHERLNDSLAKFSFLYRFNGNDDGIWIPIYLFLTAVLCLCFYRRFLDILRAHRRECLFMAGGIGLYLLGAVGMETLDNVYMLKDQNNILYHLEVSAEEFLEMFGATLVLCGAFSLYHASKQQSHPTA